MTEKRSLFQVWRECYFWALPYYLLGATLVCVLHWVNQNLGWEFSLLAMPVAWVVYRSYRLYIGRLETEKDRVEQEKAHVEEMNALHIRTIETLALAIEAKDQTTRDHLSRVQHYAVEIGKEMGLNEDELNALRAASLLHDIGKLAVPEHIITKPGKLTPQEFEKMKIHPVVGAEILEQVNFPVFGGAHRKGSPRKMGRERLSTRPGGRGDTSGRPHPFRRRLPGRSGLRPPVPARLAAGPGDGCGAGGIRQELRSAGGRAFSRGAIANWRKKPFG